MAHSFAVTLLPKKWVAKGKKKNNLLKIQKATEVQVTFIKKKKKNKPNTNAKSVSWK